MKIEIEITDSEIIEMTELANHLAKVIMFKQCGMAEIKFTDKIIGRVFDAYNKLKKEKK